MSVYYRIKNADGRYYTGSWFCHDVESAWVFARGQDEDIFQAAKYIDRTARIVKVTVKRKVKWPVERAKAWIDSRIRVGRNAPTFIPWSESERDFRHELAFEWRMPLIDIDAAVAEVLGGKL